MIICIDIGGTKTLITTFYKGEPVGDAVKIPTPKDQSVAIESICQQIDKQIDIYPSISAVSIAAPGLVVGNKLQKCGNLDWTNIDFSQIITSRFGILSVLDNDANLAGLYEIRRLQTTSNRVSLYVTISTGIGSGIILDGQIARGLSMSEAGQMMLEMEPNEFVEWEKMASGSEIYSTYDKKASEIDDPSIWYRITRQIAKGLLPSIAILQPEFIVIGGSIGTYYDKYASQLNDEMHRINQSRLVEIPILVQASKPEEAVLYGCYDNARDKF